MNFTSLNLWWFTWIIELWNKYLQEFYMINSLWMVVMRSMKDWSDDDKLVHAYGNTFMKSPKIFPFSTSSADLIHACIDIRKQWL